MERTIVLVATLLACGTAFAAANCPQYPKNEWMPRYKIDKFKVSGNCYEIYGFNKEGKKAEVYFDAKTLDVVKAEIGR